MAKAKGRSIYPRLSAYLAHAVDWRAPVPRAEESVDVMLLVIGAGLFVVFAIAGASTDDPGTLIAGMLLFVLSVVVWGVRSLKDRGGVTQPIGNHEPSAHLMHLNAARRLDHALHPSAGFLLEGAAEKWAKVRTILMSGTWVRNGLPDHWRTVKGDIHAAADEAMEEAIFLAAPYMEHPFGADEIADWRARARVAADEGRFDLHPDDLQPVIKLVRHLVMLESEVALIDPDLLLLPTVDVDTRASVNIDSVIRDLRSVVEAERELREEA